MFQVQPESVAALLNAQSEANRGKLRLDVSSRVVPDDPSVECDIVKAQQAVGERFLRAVAGFVDGVTAEWEPGHHPEPVKFMVVFNGPKPRRAEFAPGLFADLARVCGLERQSRRTAPALAVLGNDFLDWTGRTADNEAFCRAQGIEVVEEDDGRVALTWLGVPYPSVESLLGTSARGADSRSAIEYVLRDGKIQPARS